jgi:hypothetical protein
MSVVSVHNPKAGFGMSLQQANQSAGRFALSDAAQAS